MITLLRPVLRFAGVLFIVLIAGSCGLVIGMAISATP